MKLLLPETSANPEVAASVEPEMLHFDREALGLSSVACREVKQPPYRKLLDPPPS